MEDIFSIYNLSLYDIQYSRSATFYYFISSNVVFNMDIYREIVSKNLKKNGWTMVEENEYGELYCNIDNQAIGITFPTLNEKYVGLNKGYFTYQFYKTISITLYYIPNKNSVRCKGSKSKPYLQT
ncbi:hypothetical protein G9F32_13600 [Acinetobacter sp. 194]|nr:hypothetical protein [Acinetobacter shaoyimingii]